MDWNAIKVPEGAKLFKVHNYNYMFKGTNYLIELNEYSDSKWVGHGEHATDKNSVVPTVSGSSKEECLNLLVASINQRI